MKLARTLALTYAPSARRRSILLGFVLGLLTMLALGWLRGSPASPSLPSVSAAAPLPLPAHPAGQPLELPPLVPLPAALLLPAQQPAAPLPTVPQPAALLPNVPQPAAPLAPQPALLVPQPAPPVPQPAAPLPAAPLAPSSQPLSPLLPPRAPPPQEGIFALGQPPLSEEPVNEASLVDGVTGQAGSWTPYGRALQQLASQVDVKLVLELGTWNGGGSSLALARGLKESAARQGVHKLLVTTEAFTAMYESARSLLSGFPVRLMHGTSISAAELPTADQVAAEWGDSGTQRSTWEEWLKQDVQGMQRFEKPLLRDLCTNFSFDLVHIDAGARQGTALPTRSLPLPHFSYVCTHALPHTPPLSAGEFAGYKEWEIVRDVCKPRYVALHDCNQYKSRKSSREALADTETWEVHGMDFSDPPAGAGWAIFKRRAD